MEAIIFCMFWGIFICFVFFGVGLMIGREVGRRDKRSINDILCGHTDDHDSSPLHYCMRHSVVGDNDWK